MILIVPVLEKSSRATGRCLKISCVIYMPNLQSGYDWRLRNKTIVGYRGEGSIPLIFSYFWLQQIVSVFQRIMALSSGKRRCSCALKWHVPYSSYPVNSQCIVSHEIWVIDRGVLPYTGYIGMCCGIGYGFWGSRSLNRISCWRSVPLWCLDRVPKFSSA